MRSKGSAILDLAPPFDNQVLSPGSGYVVATGEAFISAGAPAGNYDFTPADGIIANTSPETDNSFVVDGNSVFPELVGGTVSIGGSSPAQQPSENEDPETGGEDSTDPVESDQVHFLRGDVNGDGVIDLTDGTQLQLLLGNGTPIECADAADVNDDGIVDDADRGGVSARAGARGVNARRARRLTGDGAVSDAEDRHHRRRRSRHEGYPSPDAHPPTSTGAFARRSRRSLCRRATMVWFQHLLGALKHPRVVDNQTGLDCKIRKFKTGHPYDVTKRAEPETRV